jgi:serine protease Do
VFKQLIICSIFLGTGTAITGVATAISPEEIGKSVKPYIVLVTSGSEVASGVIVDKTENSYTVVSIAKIFSRSKKLVISTADGKKHEILSSDIIALDTENDLSIFKFSSPQQYKAAIIVPETNLSNNSNIFIAGFPKPTRTISSPVYSIRVGIFQSRVSNSSNNSYNLAYSGNLLAGMEGGGIFDENATLIGIHRQISNRTFRTDSISPNIQFQSNSNLGVPISVYSKFILTSRSIPTRANIPSTEQIKQIQLSVQSYMLVLVDAQRLEQSGNYQGAIDKYSQLIEKYNIHLQSGDRQSTFLNYNYLVVSAYQGRANANDKLGNNKGTVADFEAALKLSPDKPELHYGLGVSLLKQGKHDIAIRSFEAAANIYRKKGDDANAAKIDSVISSFKQKI